MGKIIPFLRPVDTKHLLCAIAALISVIVDKIIAALISVTTVMICHRLSTARHADEIIVLERGSIIERGSHDELLERNGQYAEMWRIQINAGGQDSAGD
mmetsp:Transcript_5826/g.9809  ORF Transcript_5826/g.9809 Transcript_5826/m.9809 type:complete len:99 (-) Transcript_5826:85-381(-)